MGCQSDVALGDNLTFSVCTHDPGLGLLDADALPTYRVYDDSIAVPLLTGTMPKLDDAGTTGFYATQIACTVANGFAHSKSYTIYIEARVNGIPGAISFGFRVVTLAKLVWDALYSAYTAAGTMGELMQKLLMLSSGGVVVFSGNVGVTTSVQIVSGDDYFAADNSRALEWTDTAGVWPTLTGAIIVLTAKKVNDPTQTFTRAGTVVVGTGANKRVRVELLTGDTATHSGLFAYDVQATLTNGHKVTLALGRMVVSEDYTA